MTIIISDPPIRKSVHKSLRKLLKTCMNSFHRSNLEINSQMWNFGKKNNNTETIKVNTKLVERRDQKVPQEETYEHWKEIQTNE